MSNRQAMVHTVAMDDVQEVIRRNVKVLLALRGIRGAKQLAAHLGMGENSVSQKISGRRNWQLEDLPALARTFGVEPYDLLRPVADVVNAVASSGTEGAVSAGREARISTDISWFMHESMPSAADLPESDHLAEVVSLPAYRARKQVAEPAESHPVAALG